MSENSFGAKDKLAVGGREYEIFRLDALQQRFDVARLPFSLKILLENLLRTEGNGSVDAADIEALASWDPTAVPSKEIAFTPARVVMRPRSAATGGAPLLSVMPATTIQRCAACATELPERDSRTSCPSCGVLRRPTAILFIRNCLRQAGKSANISHVLAWVVLRS